MNTANELLMKPDTQKSHTSGPKVIYNSAERYCTAHPNQICFISDRQTLHLTMGSCVSTVFIGKNGRYVLAANHIVIAKAREGSPAAKKGAYEQIHEIISRFETDFGITQENIRCIHIIGGGTKQSNTSFCVHKENAIEADCVIKDLGFSSVFVDTNSFITAIYSVSRNNLSVFIENNINKDHISYNINLDLLFSTFPRDIHASGSALTAGDAFFEQLVVDGIIFGISGDRQRK